MVLNPIILTLAPIVTAIGEAVQSHTHTEFVKLGKKTLVIVDILYGVYFLSNPIAFQLHN